MIVFATLPLLLFDAPCTLKTVAGLLLLDTLLEWIRASSLLLCALSDGIFPDALMASVCVAGGQWLTNIKNICHSSFILVSTNANLFQGFLHGLDFLQLDDGFSSGSLLLIS